MKIKFYPQEADQRFVNHTISVNEFFMLHEDFVNDKTLEGLASRTISDHLKHMEYLKNYLIKEYQLNDKLEKGMLKGYVYFMMNDRQLKPCTINIRLRTLKCYLNWLYTNDHIRENLALTFSLVKVAQDTIQPLNKTEIRKMLDSCNMKTYAGFRDATIMLTILDTGIRINELCETMIDDIDIKNKLLRVRAEVSKTRVERLLPLSQQTLSLLKQLVDIAKDNSCQYVFNSNNGIKVTTEYIIRNFQRHGEKTKLGKRCTPHVWRHTFAVEAVRKGMDVFTLQRILGHTNIQTTRQYVQLQTEDLQRKHTQANILKSFIDF